MSRALAPADPFTAEFAFHPDFFRSLFNRAKKVQQDCRVLTAEGSGLIREAIDETRSTDFVIVPSCSLACCLSQNCVSVSVCELL
jgi:hypothetical protein